MTNNSLISTPLDLVNVLLIEDNAGDARLIRELLSEAQTISFALEHADRLSTGLKRIAQGGIDAVLLDLSLPDSQGLDTLFTLRSQDQEVPILVLTGLDDERTGLKAVRRGAQEYLVKGQTDAALLIRSISYAVERKRGEKALEQLSHQRELILNSAAEGIYGLDLQGRTTFVNPAAASMLGWTAEELVGQHQHNISHHSKPDGSPYSWEQCPSYEVLIDGAVRRVTNEVFWRQDGTSFPVEYVSTPIRENGAIVGVVVTFDDMTERKQAKEELLREQEFLKTLLANIGGVITACDTEGVLTLFDRDKRELFTQQVPPEEWAQHYGLYNVDGKTLMQMEEVPLYQALQGKSLQNVELVLAPEGGIARTYLANGQPLLGANGETVGAVVVMHDITERKGVEEALRERTERLDEAQRLARLGSWEWDIHNNKVSWSDELFRLFGIEPQQFGATFEAYLEYVYPDDRERVRKDIEKALQERGSFVHECRFVKPDGTVRYNQARGETILDELGNVVGMRGTAQDVTERKLAEEALEDSEERYRLMFTNSPLPMWVHDMESLRFLEVNQAAVSHYGYSREEFLSMRITDIRPEADRPLLLHNVAKMRGDVRTPTEWRHRLKGRQIIDVEIAAHTLTFDGHKAALVVATDITERKQARERLQKSEEMYRALAKNLPNGAVLMFDKELRFQLAEGAALEAQGYLKGHVEGKTIWEVLPPEGARALGPYYRQALVGQENTIEMEYLGTFYLVHFLPVKNEQGEVYAGMVVSTDITERKRAEEQRRAKEAAEVANLAKSEFLSRMSHELRTPLNSILGFAQLLELDTLEAEQHQSLDYIIKAGHHLLELINEVLDISRIEMGAISLSIEPVPLNDVLQESLDMVRSLASQRNIELRVDISEECRNAHIASDRQRVKQVFLNLLANAVKYNHEGGSVTVTCEQTDADSSELDPHNASSHSIRKLRINVSDTGDGLSPEKISRLFTPFDRLGAEQTEVEGTGLGLALSKRLVEAMGGTIGVHSTPGTGKGSVFWVELPVVESQIERLERKGTGPLTMPQALTQSYTVLYIEDNSSNLKLVERILGHSPDINLLEARQGSTGLQLAREHNPDLILLDLHLPDMQGDEVLLRLQQDPRTRAIPVVVISADATSRQIERLLATGASAYLTKPLDVKKFLEVVGSALKVEVGVQ